MNRRRLALTLAALLPFATASAVERRQSLSASKQFVIYCEDFALRSRVVSFVEDVKRDTLAMLNCSDRWAIPIVVTIEAGESSTPVTVRLNQTVEGPSIQVGVKVGSNPAAVNLQRHIIRAVMLDFMYRDRKKEVQSGVAYVEAPWWFVSGVIEHKRRLDVGVDSGFFRHLVETNKMPPIERFLAGHGMELGETAAAFDSACALVMVEMLLEHPDGKTRLANLIRMWPEIGGDQVSALTRCFPQLGTGAEGLQKWWTLNFARFSASDRYLGLSAEDTDRELNKLLEFHVVTDKQGRTKKFSVGQFAEYVKLPGAKASLSTQRNAIVGLSARANALFRPILTGYEEIFALLLAGKTKGIADQIHGVELYRTTVVHRMSDISDYLNWYEATQMPGNIKPFESYLRAAKELEEKPQQTSIGKSISDYLDLMEEVAN